MTSAFQSDPSLLWGMVIVISTLAGVVVYLHKALEKSQEANIKSLLVHKSEMQGVLEKALSAFNEVEKKIVDTDTANRTELKDIVQKTGKEITRDIRDIIKDG